MVPGKNRIYCHNSGKSKMLFEDEKKANLFIKFNAEEIKEKSGYAPVISYFCIACNGWHITSQIKHPNYKSTTEKVLEHFSMVDEGLNKLEELEKERLSEFLKHHVKITNQISYFEKAIQSCDAKKRRELLKRIFKNLKLTSVRCKKQS